MMTSTINTVPVPVSEAELCTEQHRLLFSANGQRYPLAPRAQREIATITGLTAYRMNTLAISGGIHLADQLRGSHIQMLYCSTLNNEIIAFSDQKPIPINGELIMIELELRGYAIPMRLRADGCFVATKLTSEAIHIGDDIYHAGHFVDVDLAGHSLPTVDTFIERQVCVNGQTIAVSEKMRRVPMHHREDGSVNAAMLLDHVMTWSDQRIPERILARLEAAAKTPASFAEVVGLLTLIKSSSLIGLRRSQTGSQRCVHTIADAAFGDMFGNYQNRFGVASLSEIPKRDLRSLATETSVAGLINMATELSTHHVDRRGGGTRLYAWWNRTLSRSFDLEGVATTSVAAPSWWLGDHRASAAAAMN